jgi:hypothetical protein
VDRALALAWLAIVPWAFFQYVKYHRSCEVLAESSSQWTRDSAPLSEFQDAHRRFVETVEGLALPVSRCVGRNAAEWRAVVDSAQSGEWARIVAGIRRQGRPLADADWFIREYGTREEQAAWASARASVDNEVRSRSYLLRVESPENQDPLSALPRFTVEFGLEKMLAERLSRDSLLLLPLSSVGGEADPQRDLGLITVRVEWSAPIPQTAAAPSVATLRVRLDVRTHRGISTWDGVREYDLSISLPEGEVAVRELAGDRFLAQLRKELASSSENGLPVFSRSGQDPTR